MENSLLYFVLFFCCFFSSHDVKVKGQACVDKRWGKSRSEEYIFLLREAPSWAAVVPPHRTAKPRLFSAEICLIANRCTLFAIFALHFSPALCDCAVSCYEVSRFCTSGGLKSCSFMRDFLFPDLYVGNTIKMTWPSVRSSVFRCIRITNTNLKKIKVTRLECDMFRVALELNNSKWDWYLVYLYRLKRSPRLKIKLSKNLTIGLLLEVYSIFSHHTGLCYHILFYVRTQISIDTAAFPYVRSFLLENDLLKMLQNDLIKWNYGVLKKKSRNFWFIQFYLFAKSFFFFLAVQNANARKTKKQKKTQRFSRNCISKLGLLICYHMLKKQKRVCNASKIYSDVRSGLRGKMTSRVHKFDRKREIYCQGYSACGTFSFLKRQAE